MGLDPAHIMENTSQFSKTEAQRMLREWIVSSEDNPKRREALSVYISLDGGKDLGFMNKYFLRMRVVNYRVSLLRV